jgi:hypothetical protein
VKIYQTKLVLQNENKKMEERLRTPTNLVVMLSIFVFPGVNLLQFLTGSAQPSQSLDAHATYRNRKNMSNIIESLDNDLG